jgi:hypothetical protein
MRRRLNDVSHALRRAAAVLPELMGPGALKDPHPKCPKRGDVITQASHHPMLFFGDLG